VRIPTAEHHGCVPTSNACAEDAPGIRLRCGVAPRGRSGEAKGYARNINIMKLLIIFFSSNEKL
jgi:hypothetical protein